VREVIESHPALAEGAGPIEIDEPLWALFMAFEHERIHLETSSILMRELYLPYISLYLPVSPYISRPPPSSCVSCQLLSPT